MLKNEEYVCPECGKAVDVEVIDTEFDYECMVQKVYCSHCDCSWREYFILRYDGYSHNDEEFDKQGRKVN